MNHKVGVYSELKRGTFFFSGSLNRWVMAASSFVYDHRSHPGTRGWRGLVITPQGDETTVFEPEGEEGASVVICADGNVPWSFNAEVMDQRRQKIQREFQKLADQLANLARVDTFIELSQQEVPA